MKVIKERDLFNLIRDVSEKYPNCDVYSHWKKANMYYITPINCILYALFGVFFSRKISHIYSFFNIEESSIILFLYLAVVAILSVIIMIIIHELIHLLILPHKIKNVVIVYKFPLSISVEHCVWLKKSQKLLVLISPLLLIAVFVMPLFIFRCHLLGSWFMILNISLSWADIFSFFYLLKKMPSKAYMFGNFYK